MISKNCRKAKKGGRNRKAPSWRLVLGWGVGGRNAGAWYENDKKGVKGRKLENRLT